MNSRSRLPWRPQTSRGVIRRLAACSLVLGMLSGIGLSSIAPASSATATSKNKTLFVAVSNAYNAAVSEFNVAIQSFSVCSGPACMNGAIEGLGDTRFYKATLALEKSAPYPSGVSKDVFEYVGSLVTIQKDINAMAKAKTIAAQKSIASGKLAIDLDNLSFRGMQILIYLGEQKKF